MKRWHEVNVNQWIFAEKGSPNANDVPLVERRPSGYFITLQSPRFPWYGPIKSKEAALDAALYLKE